MKAKFSCSYVTGSKHYFCVLPSFVMVFCNKAPAKCLLHYQVFNLKMQTTVTVLSYATNDLHCSLQCSLQFGCCSGFFPLLSINLLLSKRIPQTVFTHHILYVTAP